MHRVDKKRRKKIVLRVLAYGITITLSVLTTILLLYVALGYRLQQDGELVRSGLLLVDSKPEAAQVYINNELKDNEAPSRFVLSAGNYDLQLLRDGYRDWNKNITIAASSVREVNYPLLIPKEFETTSISMLQSAPSLVSQTLDRKQLLVHIKDQSVMTLLTLDPEQRRQTTVTLPSSVSNEDGMFGTFKVIEWALDNRHVLLEQTLPSGKKELLSVDTENLSETINVSTLYGNETPSNVHYVGDETNKLYGVQNGSLRRYSLNNTEIEILMQDIRSYQPYGDDTILFDRLTSSKTVEIGIRKDGSNRVIKTDASAKINTILQYARYEDHYYFIVAERNGDFVTLYRDPLEQPVVSKQTPFLTLPFSNTKKVNFSDSSQYLLMQSDDSVVTYDFEDFQQYKIDVPFQLKKGTVMSWIDAHHVQAVSTEGVGYISDYDGNNTQKLVKNRTNALYFSNNYRYVYRFTSGANNSIELDSISLVAN